MPSRPRVIYWFRTDLRLHDSPALKAALDLNPECFFPVWTWDPHYVYRARVGPNRWQFLIDCQSDLSASLTSLNKKQKLHLIREAPQTLFPKLFKAWKISHLVFEKDTDAYARDRDGEVMKLAEKAGVEVITRMGRTLYNPDDLVKENGGKPTMSISQVQKTAKGLGDPARPISAPTSLPDPGNTDLSSVDHTKPDSSPDFNAVHRSSDEKTYASIMGPKKDFAVPTLAELGMPEATTPHRGGETVALKLLDAIIKNEQYTASFEKPATAPTAFEPQATTLLSPHLHFGSLSIRENWWRVQEVLEKFKKAKKNTSSIPVNLPGQFLFRDMYFGAQAALGYEFAQAAGNKVCRFIEWHLPSTLDPSNNLLDGKYTVDSPEAEEWFRRWKTATTGFPWIDAIMRQLKHEGWIHHLARHAVACFLTRGGCYVHWERGAEVFEEWLIDHETACNAGNWMWLSCTAFFAQFYRCYSPIAFPKKWDSNGNYVRHFVPVLENFDKKYIYEPWKAPIADQKKWGCLIKGDGSEEVGDEKMKVYPKPMFDFDERRRICIDGMKKAYGIGMYGDDQRVKDGSWKKAFAFEEEEGGGGEVKDVTNGMQGTEKGKKRARGIEEEEHDDVEEVNGKADEEDEQNRAEVQRKTAQGESKQAKKGQGTLDGLVSRKRTKK